MRRIAAIALLFAGAAAALPVRHVLGTLTTQNDVVTLPLTLDDATAECTVSGTWTGTITFRSADNATVPSLATFNTIDLKRTMAGATTTTASGVFVFNVAALSALQLKATAAMTGTAVVDCQPSTGTSPATLGSVTVTAPNITKGTQGSTGYTTQDLKDAGRVSIVFNGDSLTPANTDTALTFQKNVDGVATGSLTSYAVTNGKTLRISSVTASMSESSATAVRVVFRLRRLNSGACLVSSGLVLSCEMASPGLGTSAANEGNAQCTIPIPDGYEIFGDGTKSLCFSAVGSSSAGTLTFNAIGIEY